MLKLHISCLLTAAETSACCLQDADREAAQDATRDLWGRAEAISQAAPVVSAYDASQAHQQFAGAEALSRSACLFLVRSCMCWLQQDLRCSILCCWLQQDLRCSPILCCLEASLRSSMQREVYRGSQASDFPDDVFHCLYILF